MAIGFAVATAFALIAVLIGFGYYTTVTQQIQQAKQAGVVRQLCNALYPNFTWPDNGRDTTQTFHFMLSGMLVFGSILIIWSIGAGAMRTVWLLSTDPTRLSWLGALGNNCATDGCMVQVWLFTLLQIVRATGGAVLICLGGGLVGGFFGFLFGIPHHIAANIAPPDSTAAGKDKTAKANYTLSTNLTEVSDWLTKVIVGVSLVEAKNAYGGFVTVSTTAAAWLFESRHGSPAVLAAALAGGAVFGFLFLYIYTQLILARLIDAAERALAVGVGATKKLQTVAATARRLVPPIRRTARPTDELREPSTTEYEAAMAYYSVSFNELISNPSVSDEQVRSWARSRALLNDYKSAVLAYFYLLGRESS
jgi:hypothetical protein